MSSTSPMSTAINDARPCNLDMASSPKEVSSPLSPISLEQKCGSESGTFQESDRHSFSGKDGPLEKGDSGCNGTFDGSLNGEGDRKIAYKDPYYDSDEDYSQSPNKDAVEFEEFKKKVTIIIEEYFSADDIKSTAHELRSLGLSLYHYYFIKKLVSKAMDRHDVEKEMAAVLLSALYADVIDPPQYYKGFSKLLESADDLAVDIPDTIDVLASFVARAVVDEILPPAFLAKQLRILPQDSMGIDVIKRAQKGYLSAPLYTEIILRKWGGSKTVTVEESKCKINNLLIEYISSGDKVEACRCIKQLKVPFFHHYIVKHALILAMERKQAEGRVLDLLKNAYEEGIINTSQVSKGFNRLIDMIDDLSLDIPNARDMFRSLISKAASEGWVCASSLKSLNNRPAKKVEDKRTNLFKVRSVSIIQEYFLTGDIVEVVNILESENNGGSSSLNAIFVKKLITLAMDRKKWEKEKASILLSSLCFPSQDVVTGFVYLIESAEDTSLDNPAVIEDVAMFLARSVVDEVLSPSQLEEIRSQCEGADAVCDKVLQFAHSLLDAKLSGERILRCWGGSGSSKTACEIEDVKDKIGKLLEEYESGGDLPEACRCIKELGMPFFHHEIVKRCIVNVIEKKNGRLWHLLEECFSVGLITTYQMTKGFQRVADSLDDFVLDVPDAKKQFASYVERAKRDGWLDASFLLENPAKQV